MSPLQLLMTGQFTPSAPTAAGILALGLQTESRWTLVHGRIRGLQYKYQQWASVVSLMTSILVLPPTSTLSESLLC